MITPQQFAAIVALLSASAVQADELVNRADANGDGFVSLYELRAAYYADIEFNRRIEQSFAAYDTDGDGLISEAERRAAQALAATEATPEAVPPTRASGESAIAASAGATAATVTATETRPEAVPPTRASGESAFAASAGATAATAAEAASTPPATTRRLTRSELWIQEIDSDNSGGASYNELIASGDGDQFFSSSAFTSADENDDGDLDPDELEVLIQSVERRQRYQQRGR